MGVVFVLLLLLFVVAKYRRPMKERHTRSVSLWRFKEVRFKLDLRAEKLDREALVCIFLLICLFELQVV